MKEPSEEDMRAILHMPDVESVEWAEGVLMVKLKPMLGRYRDVVGYHTLNVRKDPDPKPLHISIIIGSNQAYTTFCPEFKEAGVLADGVWRPCLGDGDFHRMFEDLLYQRQWPEAVSMLITFLLEDDTPKPEPEPMAVTTTWTWAEYNPINTQE